MAVSSVLCYGFHCLNWAMTTLTRWMRSGQILYFSGFGGPRTKFEGQAPKSSAENKLTLYVEPELCGGSWNWNTQVRRGFSPFP